MAEYAFNPITGNLDRVGTGSGPGGDITINGDTGAPIVGTDFNFVGQEAGTVPVMEVDTSSGDVSIINNAWISQYVVDPSTTVGLKGTFTTLQDAIDQIVADGGGVTPFHTIIMRPGTYPDPAIFPAGVGINVIGFQPVDAINANLGVNISGNISGASGCYVGLQGIVFSGVVDNTGFAIGSFKDCQFNTIQGSGSMSCNNCQLNGGSISGTTIIENCAMGVSGFTISGGPLIQIRKTLIYNLTVTDAPTIFIYNCSFTQSAALFSSGTFTGFITVANCIAPASSSLFNITGGTLSYGDITFPISSSVNSISNPALTPGSLSPLPSYGGNVKAVTKTAVDYTVTRYDCYVGITDTSAARTITLPAASPLSVAPYVGQEFEIKDETGGAATNNITVAGQVDGVSGFTISENYGSLRIRYDGTEFFSVPGPVSGGGGGPFLAIANNLSDLASVPTARTNLGLGTAALQANAFFLQTANNLSDVPSASTARTNLGIGTAGTQTTGFFLQTANNLSDVPVASTARTNLGLGTAAVQNNAFFLQTANNLSDVVASTARTNLGLGTAATQTNGFFLQTANNLSDVVAATARTNLGLGTAALQNNAFFAQTANNLSDLANVGTARTNLGLGTAATQTTGFFLQTANNLSDVPSPSTARTNLGIGTAGTQSTGFFVMSAGDTMTGPLVLPANPTLPLQAATKSYVDAQVAGVGGTPIGQLAYFAINGGATYPNPNWLRCDGSAVSQTTYATLYSHVGLITNPGKLWTARSSSTTSNLNAAVYGTLYVVVGNGGVVRNSTDGITWNSISSITTATLNVLTYGTVYVAAGTSASLYTSTDATTWTARTNPFPASSNFSSLAYGNSVYVGGSDGGMISTSTDAITWNTPIRLPANTTVTTIKFLNGGFVAGGIGFIATSTNGTVWNTREPSIGGTANVGPPLVWSGSLYVSNSGNQVAGEPGLITTSTDGVTWTSQVSNTTSTLQSVGFAPSGNYLAGGTGGALISSTNATTWVARTSGTSSNINSVAGGTLASATFYIYGGVGGALATSTDATTWTARTSGTTSNINCVYVVTPVNNKAIFAGAGGVLKTSTDGITWASQTSQTTSSINSVTYGGLGGGGSTGIYAYVGNGGAIATSTDAVTWVARQSNVASNLYTIVWAAGVFVASGVSGVVLTSPDGISWDAQLALPGFAMFGLAYKTISIPSWIGGTGQGLYRSQQGYVWTSDTSLGGVPNNGSITSIGFGNSKYYLSAFQSANQIATSTDANTWTAGVSPTTSIAQTVDFGNGVFVAGYQGGGIFTSTDAVTWTTQTSGTSSNINNIAYGNNNFIAASQGGLIDQSNLYTFNTATSFQLPTDAGAAITTESTTNFQRALFIKAL